MALALAEGVLGDLRRARVLVVGAGRIGLQTLKAVTGTRHRERRHREPHARDRRARWPRRFGGAAYGLDELADALAWADLVVTATSSETPVLGRELVETAVEARAERPLVIVDLAVPADVDRAAGEVDGVSLFDVDDLRAGLDGAFASRLQEVPSVEAIVEEEVAAFARRYRELDGGAARRVAAAAGRGDPRAGGRACAPPAR